MFNDMMQSTKLPPQSIEAEQSLLGALLIDKDAIVKISEILHPSNFYRSEQHGSIFEAIQKLFERTEVIRNKSWSYWTFCRDEA